MDKKIRQFETILSINKTTETTHKGLVRLRASVFTGAFFNGKEHYYGRYAPLQYYHREKSKGNLPVERKRLSVAPLCFL